MVPDVSNFNQKNNNIWPVADSDNNNFDLLN